MRLVRWLTTLAVFAAGVAWAAPHFPALTGHVVDDAHLLSPGVQGQLEGELSDHERATGEQVVVAIVPSLGGLPIEQYGVELGRYWGIGQKGKDNGAILLIAPSEKQVRIEVGYGLEGTLTDLASDLIIRNEILPRFREGQYEAGVVAGVNSILALLGGQPSVAQTKEARQPFVVFPFFLLIMLYILLRLLGAGRYAYFAGGLLGGGLGGLGGFPGGLGGGGFSGGGGSFGGGGASGQW